MRVAIAALLVSSLPAVAGGQAIRVSGTVMDEQQSPISGATVRLTGDRSATTGPSGRFEFTDAIPGRYLITATAIGHQLRTLDVTITRDTSLTFVLPRHSVTLDTVIVRPRSLHIKGTAVDSASGDFLMQAQATLYPGGRFAGAVSGVFVFDSVPPGPTTLVIEAYEHLPARVELDLARDTVLRVRMGVDSIALRMTAMQVRRLEQRSHGVAMPTKSLNRDALKREGASSLYELLMRRLYEDQYATRQTFANPPDDACYFVDESKVALQALEGMQPELVERIEIYRTAGAPSPSFRARKASTRNFGAVKMVRIYTKRYVSTLPRQDVLPLIVYMGTGLKPTCQ